jgi:hypothetical protein
MDPAGIFVRKYVRIEKTRSLSLVHFFASEFAAGADARFPYVAHEGFVLANAALAGGEFGEPFAE